MLPRRCRRLARSPFAILLLVALANTRCPAAEEPKPAGGPIPVADFFRTPLLDHPQLNQSGTYLVALAEAENDHQVALIYDLESNEKRVVAGGGDRDIYSIQWLDDHRILLSQSQRKLWVDGMFVVDAKKPKLSYNVERDSVAHVVGIPRRKPLQPIVWFERDAYSNGRDGGVARIDASAAIDSDRDSSSVLNTEYAGGGVSAVSAARVIDTYPALPAGIPYFYLADRDGELALGGSVIDGKGVLYTFAKNSWTHSPVDLDVYGLIGVGQTATELWALGPVTPGKPDALLKMNALTGAVIETIQQDDRYSVDVQRLLRNPANGQIVGFQFTRDAPVTVWLEQHYVDVQRKLDEMLPDLSVMIMDMDVSGMRLIVFAFSDRNPGDYYLLDLAKGKLSRLAASRPWIDPARMQRMQTLHYKSRDGFEIDGYLTLPPGASKQNPAPLVVLPHGGPWSRDAWGFDGEVQFFASRGYAVFQPNYRGSTGTEWRFPEEDRWEFLKMHQDVTDGVKKLLATGLVDRDRVAIMGTSFGGYLAVCGAAFEPDLYRCAVSVAGVFDWSLQLATTRSDIHDFSARYQVLLRRLGDPARQDEKFAAMSPLRHIDQVKIPIFVAHGRVDSTVDAKQSKRLVQELEKYHIPHDTLFKAEEGHGMARLADQVELYSAIESFLAKNLAPRSTLPVAPH